MTESQIPSSIGNSLESDLKFFTSGSSLETISKESSYNVHFDFADLKRYLISNLYIKTDERGLSCKLARRMLQ